MKTRYIPTGAVKISDKRSDAVASLMIRPTKNLAYAAGLDAGNKSMRQAARAKWNEADWNAATEAFNLIAATMEGMKHMGVHKKTEWCTRACIHP